MDAKCYYHIKRDGQFFCESKMSPSLKKLMQSHLRKQQWITFQQAHTSTLKACCPECTDVYYEKLKQIPLIITEV